MGEQAARADRAADLAVVLVPIVLTTVLVCGYLGVWEEIAAAIGRREPDGVNGYLLTALLTGTLGPVLGIALASRSGRRGVRTCHVVILACTLVLAALTVDAGGTNSPSVPEPVRPTYTGCVEHSGGDSDCPGG